MSEFDSKRSFKAGDIIMKQGENGDRAYIVEKGKVEILIQSPDGRIQNVGMRGPGSMIGEMALVDKAPRTATVKAVEDCEFLEITGSDFDRRLQSADPILKMATKVILARYRDTLLRAEISGENRTWPPTESVELDYSEQDDAIEKVKLANELKDAFDNGDLHLHYQPIIDLKTEEVKGFEALMRWNHPTWGPISPGIFIPSAEETGLIHEASRWALREACLALRRIESHAGLDGQLFISVNFSGSDFGMDGFADQVYKTVSESDIQARQLHIEITENMLMTNPEKAKETLTSFVDAGMNISIDDFGTGYSSLSYLHYYPINTMKIDRSFVANMDEAENTMMLVRSIVGLGQNLGLKIIAEGAERIEEVEALREMGCEMVQGFYFAKPMAEADVKAFVTPGKKKKA